MGCGKGLCEISHGKLVKYGKSSGLPEDDWKCLLLKANGELWARGPKYIAVLPPGHKSFEIRNPPGHVPADVTYLSLAEDLRGLVPGGFGSDVGRYVGGQWEIISEAKGFGKGTVASIIQDREGMVWFGLLGHGIRKWLGYGVWEQWTTRQGLHSDEIWALQRDSRRRIWVADEHGLSLCAGRNSQGHSVLHPRGSVPTHQPARKEDCETRVVQEPFNHKVRFAFCLSFVSFKNRIWVGNITLSDSSRTCMRAVWLSPSPAGLPSISR